MASVTPIKSLFADYMESTHFKKKNSYQAALPKTVNQHYFPSKLALIHELFFSEALKVGNYDLKKVSGTNGKKVQYS